MCLHPFIHTVEGGIMLIHMHPVAQYLNHVFVLLDKSENAYACLLKLDFPDSLDKSQWTVASSYFKQASSSYHMLGV